MVSLWGSSCTGGLFISLGGSKWGFTKSFVGSNAILLVSLVLFSYFSLGLGRTGRRGGRRLGGMDGGSMG